MIGSCSENDVTMVEDSRPSMMFEKKQASKKILIIRKRTRSPTSGSFIPLLPVEYRLYIVECKDVKGDGHCGFRVVAALMGFGEDNWAKGVFKEDDRVMDILNALNCFTETAQYKHWFHLPYMGYLVASTYNVAFITLSNAVSLTFLPLRSAVPERKIHLYGHGEQQPFYPGIPIVLLAVGRALPPITASWNEHHVKPVASRWNNVLGNIPCMDLFECI
ncbi:hypothetical protein ACS0TY_035485 [Phlomoides rotata]